VIVGILTAITGRYRWALWLGWCLTTLGMGLLYLLTPYTSTATWVFLNLVPGLGTGILFAGMGIAIPAAADPKDMAHAVAFYSFFRAFGQGIGVAVGGVVFQNVMERKLDGYAALKPLAETYSKDAAALVQVLKAMEKGVVRDELVLAYADSLKVVWVTMCGLAGVALVTNLFVKGYTLEKEMETEQGFVHEKRAGDAEINDEGNEIEL
jgi:MFS family permease